MRDAVRPTATVLYPVCIILFALSGCGGPADDASQGGSLVDGIVTGSTDNTVVAGDTAAFEPADDFILTPVVGEAPLATTVALPGGPAATNADAYTWDFDDGTTVSGASAEHTFDTPGIYEVRLLIDLGNGLEPVANQTVAVLPDLDFVMAPDDGIGEAPFELELSVDPESLLSQLPSGFDLHWSLGDGSTEEGSRVRHVYRRPGTYTVILTAVSAMLSVDCAQREVVVQPKSPPSQAIPGDDGESDDGRPSDPPNDGNSEDDGAGDGVSDSLAVAPGSGFEVATVVGGPFDASGKTYTLSNTGASTMMWSADASTTWISVAPQGGTLDPGASVDVVAAVNDQAETLPAGEHFADVVFQDLSSDGPPLSRGVTLILSAPPNTPAELVVSPDDTLAGSGPIGGEFNPSQHAYTLTNVGGEPLNWHVSCDAVWIKLDATQGALPAGASQSLIAKIGGAAEALPVGTHEAHLTFMDASNDATLASRTIALTVTPLPPQIAPLSDNATAPGVAYARTPSLTRGSTPVAWSLLDGPSDMTIDANSGTVSWANPRPPDTHHLIRIRVSNAAGTDEATWTLTVHPEEPVIAELSDDAVDPGTSYGRTPSLVQGTAPVTWSLPSGPTGMTINAETGRVSWTNPQPQNSSHTITIRATNVAGSDDASWTLNVTSDDPPVIAALTDDEVEPDAAYGRTPSLVEGTPPVTWSLVTGPSGMVVDSETGIVSWAGPHDPNQTHEVTIRATNLAGSDTETWEVYVRPALAGSLSQYGITWTFDREYRVGQFVNGDWWVIPETPGGTVTVVNVDPVPTGSGASRRNGMQLNPTATSDKQGYDGRDYAASGSNYDESLTVNVPMALSGDDSLVSTISRPENDGNRENLLGRTVSLAKTKLLAAAVLTCLDSPPANDAFRPPFGGTNKPLFRKSDLRLGLLPSLTPPSIGDLHAWGKFAYQIPEDRTVGQHYARYFQRPHLNHVINDTGRNIRPLDNCDGYYSCCHSVESDAALILLCDPDSDLFGGDGGSREDVLINFVQFGIDTYYMIQTNPDPARRGDRCLSKWPSIFAGIMLDNEAMRTEHNYARPGDSFDLYKTDACTYYGTPWTNPTYRPVAYNNALYRNDPPNAEADPDDYKYEHLDPFTDGWCDTYPGQVPYWKEEVYRRSTHSWTWIGTALAARLMNAQDDWGHDPFFDYIDRWMEEDESAWFADLDALGNSAPTGPCGDHQYDLLYQQGPPFWLDFVCAMWDEYR